MDPEFAASSGMDPEMHVELSASKGDNASILLKIDRNTNITVETGNGHWVSCVTSRGIPIALPSLEENLKVSLATKEEC